MFLWSQKLVTFSIFVHDKYLVDAYAPYNWSKNSNPLTQIENNTSIFFKIKLGFGKSSETFSGKTVSLVTTWLLCKIFENIFRHALLQVLLLVNLCLTSFKSDSPSVLFCLVLDWSQILKIMKHLMLFQVPTLNPPLKYFQPLVLFWTPWKHKNLSIWIIHT